MATITLKLVVEKKKNRVVLAEADEDFVDILCSFLTLPLGTVVRVLGKKSMLGCMDKLYRSVENLDAKYLQTEACKKMLLEPRSESEVPCEDLKLNVGNLHARTLYRCPVFECFTKTHRLYSSVSGVPCRCGNAMDKPCKWTKEEVARGCNNKDGVFLKGGKRFMISDDLHVTPLHCMESTLSLFQKNGINDMDAVETKTVVVTKNEILMLLGRLLVSSAPLTDVFLLNVLGPLKCPSVDVANCQPIHATTTTATPMLVGVKLLYDVKASNKVPSVQAGEDFVDILFSFLTLPLGCIVKLLEMNSSLGCLDNLYKSIKSLGKDPDYIESKERMNMLVAPKLYPYFGCINQLLGVEEKPSGGARAYGCEDCWKGNSKVTNSACEHNIAVVTIKEVNPKLPSPGTEREGGYAMKSFRFMVTDEMEVMPLSSISAIDAIKESKAVIDSLVEREVSLGEIEVLHLLKACLISRAPLSNVFSTHLSNIGLGLGGKEDFCPMEAVKETKGGDSKWGILSCLRGLILAAHPNLHSDLKERNLQGLDSLVDFAYHLLNILWSNF